MKHKKNGRQVNGFIRNGLYYLKYSDLFEQDFQLFIEHLDDQALLADSKPPNAAVLWHNRLFHSSMDRIKRGIRLQTLPINLKAEDFDHIGMCSGCATGSCIKHPARTSSFPANIRAPQILGRLYFDNCGPISPTSATGKRHFSCVVDEFSRRSGVKFITTRDQSLESFKNIEREWARPTDLKIVAVRHDSDKALCEGQFKNYLLECGITRELTAAEEHTQNGIGERMIGVITNMARIAMCHFDVPRRFWPEAVATASYVRNLLPCSANQGFQSPMQMWLGRSEPLSVDHLRFFGCFCVFTVLDQEKVRSQKFNATGVAGALMGYEEGRVGWRVYHPEKQAILFRAHVYFDETKRGIFEMSDQAASDPVEDSHIEWGIPVLKELASDPCAIPSLSGQPTLGLIPQTEEHLVNDLKIAENAKDAAQEQANMDAAQVMDNAAPKGKRKANVKGQPPVRASTRISRPVAYNPEMPFLSHAVYQSSSLEEMALAASEQAFNIKTPDSYSEAMRSEQKENWISAINTELQALSRRQVFVNATLPQGRKAIATKWVFKVKGLTNGEVDKFKARLTVKGFMQVPGLDYQETYSPVVNIVSLRCLFSIAAAQNLELYHVDVTSAFLYGELDEEIYIRFPDGMEAAQNSDCMLLKRALPGCKQSGRQWNQQLDGFFTECGFTASMYDPCLYIKLHQGRTILVGVEVDDMAMAGTIPDLDEVVASMKRKYEITVDKNLSWFLNISITRDRAARTLSMSQERYLINSLERFGMKDCNSAQTPATLDPLLCTGPSVSVPMREAIGALLWLARMTRPDIQNALMRAARFSAAPNAQAWQAVKRIFRYLKGTMHFSLPLGSQNVETVQSPSPLYLNDLKGYADADYAGDLVERKSTSGNLTMLGESPIAWSCSLQRCVSTSTAEAELVSACAQAKDLVWIRSLLASMNVQWLSEPEPTILFEDNTAAISMIKNTGGDQKRAKHIDIRYHYTRQQVSNGTILVQHCPTENMLADILTKPLAPQRHYEITSKILTV